MKKSLLLTSVALFFCSRLVAQQQPEIGQKPTLQQFPNTTVGQEPGTSEENRLKDRIKKLEKLVQALGHENELLKKRLKEYSEKPKENESH